MRRRRRRPDLPPYGGQGFDRPFHVADLRRPSRLSVAEARGRSVWSRTASPSIPTPSSTSRRTSGTSHEGGASAASSRCRRDRLRESGLLYVFYTRDDPLPGRTTYLRIEELRAVGGRPRPRRPRQAPDRTEIPHLTGTTQRRPAPPSPDGLLHLGRRRRRRRWRPRPCTRLGKLLRIDGRSAPWQSDTPGNPFADGPGGNADEIYSYGLRNPYRFSFDRQMGISYRGRGRGELGEVD